jgi:hypothetical protein
MKPNWEQVRAIAHKVLVVVAITVFALVLIYNVGGFWYHLWERHQ